jgi:hypothetical protein
VRRADAVMAICIRRGFLQQHDPVSPCGPIDHMCLACLDCISQPNIEMMPPFSGCIPTNLQLLHSCSTCTVTPFSVLELGHVLATLLVLTC